MRWMLVRGAAAALIAVVSLIAAVSADAAALVPGPAELAAFGLRAAPWSSAAAERQLVAALPAPQRSLLDGVSVQASAGTARGETIQFEAFTLSSTRAATRLLAAWRRSTGATVLRLGDGGAVSRSAGRRRAVVQVLWRAGARLGLVVLSTTRDVSSAESAATALAQSAQAVLAARGPGSPLQQVLDEIGPNGSMPVRAALQAFALAYGRLPGVSPPEGALTPVADGTQELIWALVDRPRESKAQVAAVDRLAGLPSSGAGTLRAHGADYSDPGFTPNPYIQGIVNGWIPVLAAKLGRPMTLKVVAGYTTTDIKPALADSLPLNADEGWGLG